MDKQTWALDGYLRAWWHDIRLEYNGTEAGGCTDMLSFKQEERGRIWKPEFYWEGAKSVTLPNPGKGAGELLKVDAAGHVFWSRQVSLVLGCPFSQGKNLDKLPFDTQACTFMMGMYAETAEELVLTWKSDATSLVNWQGACLAEWHATGLEQTDARYSYASGNYTYAEATVRFTRSPEKWMSSYFMPSVIMVMLSYLGFYLDPAATPARVALGMLCLLVVMTNFVSLSRILPPTATPTWLSRVMLGSFVFNVIAMVEQVTVSFGLISSKWLERQREAVQKSMPWKKALVLSKRKVLSLFSIWDESKDGVISRREFRRGIQRLGFEAPTSEVNDLFDRFDADQSQGLDLNEIGTMLDALEGELLNDEEKRRARGTSQSAVDTTSAAPEIKEVDVRVSKGRDSTIQALEVDIDIQQPATSATANERPLFTPHQTRERSLKRARSRADVTQSVRALRAKAKEDLDRGLVWELKFFVIFPLLGKLSQMDSIFRIVFPIAYLIYLMATLSEIGFGRETHALLATAPCYVAAIAA